MSHMAGVHRYNTGMCMYVQVDSMICGADEAYDTREGWGSQTPATALPAMGAI